jgi:hypothetical protein
MRKKKIIRICELLFYHPILWNFYELLISLIAFYIYKLILLFGCPEQLYNCQTPDLPILSSPAIDWKIWKALYSRVWSFVLLSHFWQFWCYFGPWKCSSYPSWRVLGLSLDCLWNVSRLTLDSVWTVSGLSLDCLWTVSGLTDWICPRYDCICLSYIWLDLS